MVALADALLAHRPRETSGASSANRFEYQRTWALCHLLKLHATDQHYVLILEFHDDVLVLDREVEPTAAEFFQVKTRKDGQWSQRELLKTSPAPKGKIKKKSQNKGNAVNDDSDQEPLDSTPLPQSILGKLLDHCRHFLPQIKSLNIVSNVSFKLPLTNAPASVDRERFSLNELKEKSLGEVKDAIKKELALEGDLPWEKVYLVASAIGVAEHELYGAGQLAAFLEKRRPGARYAVQPLFRTLCGELGRRATNEWQPTSFDELCEKKGIRRIDLEAFLRLAENQPDPEAQRISVGQQLLHEGLDYRTVGEIDASWRRYDIERMDQTNMMVQTLKEQLVRVVDQVALSTNWRSLRDFVSEALRTFLSTYGAPSPPFNNKYLQGALLHEFKAHETRQFSSSDSQSSAGEP